MKKKLLLLCSFIILFFNSFAFAWDKCDFNEWTEIADLVDTCMLEWWSTKLVNWEKLNFNLRVAVNGFYEQIDEWVMDIGVFLWILAVWAIVYGWLMMTFSGWEDEKIKKAKNIIKWWIIWFVLLISVRSIIMIIVKLVYSI